MPDRDPRVDPRVGDIVRGVAANHAMHVSRFYTLTVQAVVGNLVAASWDEHGCNITWIRQEDWCPTDSWVKEWKVIHAAE